jgi:hypothetical protein
MLGQDSWDRETAKYSRDRTIREDSQDGTGRTRKRGQDAQNLIEGQDSLIRTTEMG